MLRNVISFLIVIILSIYPILHLHLNPSMASSASTVVPWTAESETDSLSYYVKTPIVINLISPLFP